MLYTNMDSFSVLFGIKPLSSLLSGIYVLYVVSGGYNYISMIYTIHVWGYHSFIRSYNYFSTLFCLIDLPEADFQENNLKKVLPPKLRARGYIPYLKLGDDSNRLKNVEKHSILQKREALMNASLKKWMQFWQLICVACCYFIQ